MDEILGGDSEFYFRFREWDYTGVDVQVIVLKVSGGPTLAAGPLVKGQPPFSILAPWLANDNFIFCAHNAHTEWNVLKALGLPIPRRWLDTMTAAAYLDVRDVGHLQRDYTLLEVARRNGFHVRDVLHKEHMRQCIIKRDFRDPERIVRYCADDVDDCLKVAQKQLPRLDRHFWQLVQPLQVKLLEIHDRGLRVDVETMCQIQDKAIPLLNRLQKKIKDLGFQGQFHDFERLSAVRHNLDMQRTLYVLEQEDILATLPIFKKDEELSAWEWQRRQMTPFFKAEDKGATERQRAFFVAAGDYHGLLDLIANDWRFFINSDGRIRFNFRFPGSSSYRISPRKPHPLMLSKEFRPILMASPGHAIVEIDFACQEFGLSAAWFGDQKMLQQFNDYEGDLYISVGEQMKVIEERSTVKTSVISMLYGAGTPALCKKLLCSEPEALRLISAFHSTYPALFIARNAYLAAVKTCGYAWNALDMRRKHEPYVLLADGAHDTALSMLNFPVQSGGSLVMAELIFNMPAWIKIVSTCHDSVLIECPQEAVPKTVATAKAVMTAAMDRFPGVKSRVKSQAAFRFYKDEASSVHTFCEKLGLTLTAPIGWVWDPPH
ncbi:MAG TPA: DNA polymerase [Planctomycetota bacterium]|jgi:DNA polymerase I-like protein with 3'-5' exonuclease and polymerase domains